MILKLGMKHLGMDLYKTCINHYVTGTLETAHSRGISDESMLRFEGF